MLDQPGITPHSETRSASGGKRVNYHDDFELVALRHRELTRSLACFPVKPVPAAAAPVGRCARCRRGLSDCCTQPVRPQFRAAVPDARYKKYQHVIKTAAGAFFNNPKYKNVLLANGYDADDLFSFGLGWATNFFLYEVPPERDLDNDNQKLLYTHLMQRMTELVGTLFKKQKDVIPEREVATSFSLGDHSFSLTKQALHAEDELDRRWLRRYRRVDLRDDHRDDSAKRMLHEQLARMPHDKMIEVLMTAAQNRADCEVCDGKNDSICTHCNKLCPESREEARKLADAAKGCTSASPCPICRIKGRDMDKRMNPLIKDPKSNAATISIPQANSLALVRLAVEDVVHADGRFEREQGLEGANHKSVRRHLLYYRQAARVLGLLATNKGNNWSPTKHGFDLIATARGSHDERLILRDRISSSPGMDRLSWYFNPPNDRHSKMRTEIEAQKTPRGKLAAEVEFLTEEVSRLTGLNAETARRRASTLVHWRGYAWGGEQLELPRTEDQPAAA